MSLKHHGLDLLKGLKDDTHNDDQRSTTEGYVCSENTVKDDRDDSCDGQANRADEDDAVQNFVQVVTGRSARTDTRNKTAPFFHIVC